MQTGLFSGALCLDRTVVTDETPQDKGEESPVRPLLPTIFLANVQSLDSTLCAGAHLIPTRNKGLLHYLPHRNLDVCNGSRLSHQAYRVRRALLGQNERAHWKKQRWGHLLMV